MAKENTPPPIPMRPGGGPQRGPRMTEKPRNTKKTLLRLLSYIGKSRALLLSLLVIMLISTLCSLVAPMLQGKAIDAIEGVRVTEYGEGIAYEYQKEGETLLKTDGGVFVAVWEEDAFYPSNENGVRVSDTPLPIKTHLELRVHLMPEEYFGREGETLGLVLCLSFLAAAAVGAALFAFFQQRLAAKLSQFTVYSMRNDLFRKISSLPIRYTDTHKHGDLMSRMTTDVENVSNAISQSIASLFSAVITIVGALIFMLTISPLLTAVALITIPFTVFVTTFLSKFMRKYFVRQQKLLGRLNGQVEEMVTSYKTVVAYGKEGEAVERFSDVSEELCRCAIRAKVWGSIMGPVMNFLGNLQYVLIAATGGITLLFYGMGTVGGIQSMLQYSKNFTRPINEVANQFSSILTALAGAERIFEVMDNDPEIDEGKTVPPSIRGELSFEDVHFGYEKNEPVLKGFTLSVEQGKKIAIVGATGSGKTTVINLLTRFYEPDSGRIAIDGVDIADIPKDTLRHAIGIVLQDTVLFRGTISENIRYGRLDATEEEMRAAADMTKASSFIDRLPDGYETELSEGGSNLSQGQRQLLAITRAIIADPRILILDEATSNVDTRTEMDIQQALIRLMKNRTSLIIAHRLSTIRDADAIIVIKNGVIAECGSHDTLLSQNGEYAKLYQSQFLGQFT